MVSPSIHISIFNRLALGEGELLGSTSACITQCFMLTQTCASPKQVTEPTIKPKRTYFIQKPVKMKVAVSWNPQLFRYTLNSAAISGA